jgi:predicted nucleic acid-binding protein
VTRYLLDTNFISNIVKPKPSASLLAWMGKRRDEDSFIASLTIAEIRRGILERQPDALAMAIRPQVAAL